MKRLQKFFPGIVPDNVGCIKANRGFALLSAIMLTIFLGLLIGAAFMGMAMQMQESEARMRSHDSFYTAEAGLARVIFELRQNSNWRPPVLGLTENLLLVPADPASIIGRYTVDVAPAPDWPGGWPSVWVRSTGEDFVPPLDFSFPRTILARIVVQNPANFLAFTLGQMTVLSGVNQTGNLLARDVNFLVDTTQAPGPSRDIQINGNVEYMRSINSNVPINPVNGITISGSTGLAPSIPFSGIDVPYFTSLATIGGRLEAGNTSFSGNINRTDLASPNGVVMVQGDVRISGNVSESMVIVASGNIYIDGNVTVTGGPPRPQIGLLAAKDVIISSSVPPVLGLEAFILADGGQFRAETGGAAKNTLNFNGAMSVRGNGTNTAIDLSPFPIRNVVYNSALATNSQIPFLPFIVSVVRWQETEPTAVFPPP